MKLLFTSVVSIIAVVAVAAGCRTTNPAETAEGSGLSEVSVPVPAEVASKLGDRGKAILYANGDARQFLANIVFESGDNGNATVTFEADTDSKRMQRGQTLTDVRIELLDSEAQPIYQARGEPSTLNLEFGENKVTFKLKCHETSQAAKLKCNFNESIEVVGLQGPAGQTAASVVADLTIDENGLTFDQVKEKIVECMRVFEGNGQIICDRYVGSAGGVETCERLNNLKKSGGVYASLPDFASKINDVTTLNNYKGYCDKLGIIRINN